MSNYETDKKAIKNNLPFIRKLLNFWLFHQSRTSPGFIQIVGWWELRRIFFNLIVGCTGIASLIICALCDFLYIKFFRTDFMQSWDSPLISILLYGIVANICYTSGWFSEILARYIWKSKADHFGEFCFTFGLIISLVLTLLPAVIWIVIFIAACFR